MYLTIMTHRDELFELTLRWMNDDFRSEDGEKITRIFLYESAISSIVVDRVIQFLGRFCKTPLHLERVHSKHELREHIIAHQPVRNPRTDELTENFQQNPEYFYPHLPIDSVIITDRSSHLFAIGRIKRLTRIAEKVSFRLVETLFNEIQATARQFAEQRAKNAGIPLNALISSPTAMQNDFVEAEAAVARKFMDKKVDIESEALTVNDIVGFKIAGQPDMLERIPALLSEEPGVGVAEIQKHSGDYNAVNLLVDIDLPAPDALADHLHGFNWEMARQRGLDPGDIRRNIFGYVSQGARSVRIELILTTYEELMEAEFGRSIHELRVQRLRQRQAYCGPLGQNAGYLIEYLLALASSPTVSVQGIPIKMYGRYLPEEITALKCALHGNAIDGGLLGTFCLQQDCTGQFCSAGELLNSVIRNDFGEDGVCFQKQFKKSEKGKSRCR